MYRVKDWDQHYENSRSREILDLEWVPFKNQHDGDGITELLEDHPNGMAHLGAWVLLVQVASKCGKPAGRCGEGDTPRGTLRRDNGKPHDIRSIARMSGGKLETFEEAIPRFLEIGWLEIIPDPSETCTKPQAGAVTPQAPARLPQDAADRARGRVPFSSLQFLEDGGSGEGTAPSPAPTHGPGMGQDHLDRASAVIRLYPEKADKDGRPIRFTLEAQNLLGAKIARHPDYPWEEHAELERRNPTPPDGLRWVQDMPNPAQLERMRKAARPVQAERRKL